MEGSTNVLSSDLITAITSGCQRIATGASEGIAAIVPMGLEVAAITIGLRIAFNFFRSLAH